MIRRNAFTIALGAALLMAAGAHANDSRDEIQAPRAQDVQAPRGDHEEIQAPRGDREEFQAPRGDQDDLQAPRGK